MKRMLKFAPSSYLKEMQTKGASVVITHHIKDGKQQEYEMWLEEITPLCRNAKGNIDWQIIRPIPNLTYTYTVIIRFDTVENLKNWMESDVRNQLIEKAVPLFEKEDHYHIQSGLDFMFMGEQETAKAPVRWKQFLVTWSAILPLSILVPMVVLPILKFLGIPEIRWIHSFFVTGIIVWIMIYPLMPNYTKLIKKWLFK